MMGTKQDTQQEPQTTSTTTENQNNKELPQQGQGAHNHTIHTRAMREPQKHIQKICTNLFQKWQNIKGYLNSTQRQGLNKT